MTTQQKSAAAKRRPDDKPYDFNLDAVKAEAEMTPWVVVHAGRRWTFEHMRALNIMPLIKSAQLGDASAVIGTLREALGEQWADFEEVGLPQWKAQKLFEAYQTHCGLQPGESLASPES
ncbi:hypothetical protein [Streptomyces cyaneofuscatus]|uniref:hypothetical protein n=1 Tax=Streptomyces cyaneofuscatus TaxID=66883 RepID=UPI00381A8244